MKTDGQQLTRLLPYAAPLLAFLALTALEADLLWNVQEQSLFLHTPLFFRQAMLASGGLLTWAGCYLTQFFFYPALGAALLALLWTLLMMLLSKTFRLSPLLASIPVALLLLAVTAQGYWLYFLKLPGHCFVPTLGATLCAALVWAYRSLPPHHHLPTLFIVLTTLVGYPLFGSYALAAVVLMAVKPRHRLADPLAAVLAVVAVPLLSYHTLYHATPLENIYWTALPIFVHNGMVDAWAYAPYASLTAWFLLAALAPRHIPAWLQTTLLVLTLAGVVRGWNHDDNLHRELTMRRQLEQQQWQPMLDTFSQASGESTRAMCLMRNLALQRQGRLSTHVNNFREGFSRPQAPFPVHMVHTVGKALYLQFGIPNYCYRWCMEDGVEYGWTAEELKLMTKCSLINGEPAAAQRYVSLLKKTLFHRSWARHYEAYIHRPSLMAQDAEFRAIAPLLRQDDFLTSDQSQMEPFLIEHFASSPGETQQQQELARFYLPYYFNRFKYAEQ